MPAEEAAPFTLEDARRCNGKAVGPAAARWVRVANEALLVQGRARGDAIREANAAVRDERDAPRPL